MRKTYKEYFKNEIEQTIKDLANDYELEESDIICKLHNRKQYKKFTYFEILFWDITSNKIVDSLKLAVINNRNDYINKQRGFNCNRSANHGVCFYNDIDFFVWKGL